MNLQFEPSFGLNFPRDFQLEPMSIESGGELIPSVLIDAIVKRDEQITDDSFPLLSHALMLFANLVNDTAFDGITPDQLFAACCDTVLIWCDG